MVQLGPSSARDVGPSRRNKLCSRGRISPEIITSLYIVPRNFTRILLEILSFPAAAAAAARPRKRYTYMYTFLDRFTRSFHPPFPPPPRYHYRIYPFWVFLIAEIRSTMPPMINEKVVYTSARLKDTVVIPCVAYGNPTPANR